MKIDFLSSTVKKLNRLLNKKQKVYLLGVLLLTILLSVVETVGVSIIMPFISIASNPGLVNSGKYKMVFDFFNPPTVNSFIVAFGIGIIIFYIFRSCYNFFYTYTLNKFSLGMFRYFSDKLFKVYISLPYKLFVQKNSSDIIHVTLGTSGDTSSLILNFMQMCSEIFTVILIYAVMIVMDWKMTLVFTGIIVIILLFILQVFLKNVKKQGERKNLAGMKLNRMVRETHGNYKFVKLKGNEEYLYNAFDASALTSSRAQIISNTIGAMPKNILESLGFALLVAAVVFIIFFYKSPGNVIPTIAMYALALYRILPGIHKMLQNVNQIIYHQFALDLVYENSNQETVHEGSAPLEFEKEIRIENLSFEYVEGKGVLDTISLTITKGEKIAIVGASGGGKSTLVDLIIGINRPTVGAIYIDDTAITDENIRSWRRKIGYIPQDIYLFDGTVADNVAFGSEFNEERIIRVLKMANVWDFISQKDGINTIVGEGGIQLSGGQKQRIGIARAFYDDPEILVLDEATSALDNDTESKIMDEIYSLSSDKTLIVVAHRLSTVTRCERKITIENGNVV
ncbi:multidrug transporter [Spirochaetia bacterium]|nr:multidrug transporter [Spirochaetia bacterium]